MTANPTKTAIVVIVVIMIAIYVSQTGKQAASTTPLQVMDVTNADVQFANPPLVGYTWTIQYDYVGIGDFGTSAYNFGTGNWDYSHGTPLGSPASLRLNMVRSGTTSGDKLTFSGGDRITVTYDGGQAISIYMPVGDTLGYGGLLLYVADDGSTYYDEGLNNIAQEAPATGYCGDGACGAGEDCSNCPSDCGSCAPYCGDGSCNGTEDCSSCPQDCGICSGCGVTYNEFKDYRDAWVDCGASPC